MAREFIADKDIILRGFRDQDVVFETFVESVVKNLHGQELTIDE
jgi:succinate dehydrogenase flavin-adding protein (antitoxin of CptAB toxin-antitoxin module)